MPKPSVYKITDTHDKEENSLYIKTAMKQNDLLKLINVWQIKLAQECETMAFTIDEVVEILKCFGVNEISKDDDFKSCWVIDIYIIWETGCLTEEDLNNPKYNNQKAEEIMKRVIKETNEYYERQSKDN